MRNENIKERLKAESIAERCRKARLRWFGHVKRRDQDYVGRQTLAMVPPGRRKRGRSKQRWMDCVNRDMRAIGTTKDEVHDRTGWRRIVSAAATPTTKWEQLEEEEDSFTLGWFLTIASMCKPSDRLSSLSNYLFLLLSHSTEMTQQTYNCEPF